MGLEAIRMKKGSIPETFSIVTGQNLLAATSLRNAALVTPLIPAFLAESPNDQISRLRLPLWTRIGKAESSPCCSGTPKPVISWDARCRAPETGIQAQRTLSNPFRLGHY
jgi:hypothetical protein